MINSNNKTRETYLPIGKELKQIVKKWIKFLKAIDFFGVFNIFNRWKRIGAIYNQQTLECDGEVPAWLKKVAYNWYWHRCPRKYNVRKHFVGKNFIYRVDWVAGDRQGEVKTFFYKKKR